MYLKAGQRLYLRVLWTNYYSYDELRIAIEISLAQTSPMDDSADSDAPTTSPTRTYFPSGLPTSDPTIAMPSCPSGMPTSEPTLEAYPSGTPTGDPTQGSYPSGLPTANPTYESSSGKPSLSPTSSPSDNLAFASNVPLNLRTYNNLPEVQLVQLSFINVYEQQELRIQGKNRYLIGADVTQI